MTPRARCVLAGLTALASAAAAGAVGLGPLTKSGVTDGPAKAFYLTLYNPYPARTAFRLYAVGNQDEVAQDRVRVPSGPVPLGAEKTRKFMVVASGLQPGEHYAFRVCAEKATPAEREIHARVCSRLVARRLAAGA